MSLICPRCDRVPASGVAAGSPCADCGEILIEDPLGSLGDLNVVTLDARAGAPPLAPVQPPAAAPPAPTTLAELAPADDLPLEVDPAWTAARAVRQEAARRPAPRPPRRIAGVVVALLLMAAAAVAIVVLVRRPPSPQQATVTIQLTGKRGADVLVDGRRVGKLPLSLVLPRRTQPILVTSNRVTRQLVPDRDRTLDLAP